MGDIDQVAFPFLGYLFVSVDMPGGRLKPDSPGTLAKFLHFLRKWLTNAHFHARLFTIRIEETKKRNDMKNTTDPATQTLDTCAGALKPRVPTTRLTPGPKRGPSFYENFSRFNEPASPLPVAKSIRDISQKLNSHTKGKSMETISEKSNCNFDKGNHKITTNFAPSRSPHFNCDLAYFRWQRPGNYTLRLAIFAFSKKICRAFHLSRAPA
jgi:hypothetical protein